MVHYHFADYKGKIVGLLLRMAALSVRTVAILQAMKNASK
jgi:hypothetical protein